MQGTICEWAPCILRMRTHRNEIRRHDQSTLDKEGFRSGWTHDLSLKSENRMRLEAREGQRRGTR